MDTTYHSNIPIETLSLLDCDVRNFDFNHPIKNIFFDNIEYIRKLDASGKARPCILDNVERSLLCHTCYLGFDQFECPDCDNWNIIPHSCHSRFCNACGVKYAKQLAAKATSFCLDCPHRHIVFTIPEELRNWFRQDRTRLNLLFVASRNTISILTNKSLADKLKKKKLSDTHYIFKDIPVRNEFGMIATLHTFGRDLKWNPHIHCLIPELIYSFKKDKIKTFHHFNFKSNHNNYCAKGAQKSAHKKSPPKRAGIWIIFHENHPILKEYSLSMLRSFLRGFSYLSQNAAIGRAYRDISCDPNWTRQKEMSPLLQRSRQYSGRDHLPKG